MSVIEDLTEVKRAELAQRVLAEAGQALSSSLDYEQTLQRVAELAVSAPGGLVRRGDARGDSARWSRSRMSTRQGRARARRRGGHSTAPARAAR